MRRKDMHRDVLYAIKPSAHQNPQPGYVLDTGNPIAQQRDVRVRCFWTFPGWDEDHLQEHPDLLSPLAKSEEHKVGTADVIGVWAEWALMEKRRKAAQWQAHLDREAAEAARQQAILDSHLAQVENVRFLADNATGYLTIARLVDDAKRGDWHRGQYSAAEVVALLSDVAGLMRSSS